MCESADSGLIVGQPRPVTVIKIAQQMSTNLIYAVIHFQILNCTLRDAGDNFHACVSASLVSPPAREIVTSRTSWSSQRECTTTVQIQYGLSPSVLSLPQVPSWLSLPCECTRT
jgi:hypothetical protein